MTAEARDPSAELGVSSRALELGDWPTVLSPERWARPLDGSTDASRLAVVHRIVAYSMKLQAAGDHRGAWLQLGAAAGMLPPALRRPVESGGGGPLAVLAPAPPTTQPGSSWLTWATSRVIWREQQELAQLRHRLLPGRSTPRGDLVDGCVEHLRWIEYDPYAWEVRADVSVGRARSDLYRRANNLRRFAAPRSADLSMAVWRTIGRYPGLRAEAMRRLIATPLVPWAGANNLATSVEVRRGRRRALLAAQEWIADLEY